MIRPLTLVVLACAVGLAVPVSWVLYSRSVVSALEVGPGSGNLQQNWSMSMALCDEQGSGWRLPGISELLGIYYWRDDVVLHPRTDYWSADVIAGYGFGLNSHLGWLSFDRLADEDHALCVRGVAK